MSDAEVAIFVRRGDEFLVLHRSPEDDAYWHVVAGGVEDGESFAAAAARELAEETGLVAERCWRRSAAVRATTRSTVDCDLVDAPPAGSPTLDWEHDDYRWCTAAEAPRCSTGRSRRTCCAASPDRAGPALRGEGPPALWHVSEDDVASADFEPARRQGLGDRHAPPAALLVPARLPPRDLLGDAAHGRGGRRPVSRTATATGACTSSSPHWLDRMRSARVVAYRLPEEPFERWDRFWIARPAPSSRSRWSSSATSSHGTRRQASSSARTTTCRALGARDRVDARLQRHPAPERDDGAVRILVAEDETIIRLDLRDLLVRAGFEVCAEARDGEEAVALARSEQPDLAIMDVKMPRLDGIEAARRILDERPIPIVMLTAYGQEELVSRAVEAGVFGYLVKPFREQDLLPAIHAARARHEELQALREEAESLAEALAARKVIERAKGLLMEKEKLSEQEAFARLRKASQASGRPLKVIAEAVVATLEEEHVNAEHPNAALDAARVRRVRAGSEGDRRRARTRRRLARSRQHDHERRVPRPARGRRVPPPHRHSRPTARTAAGCTPCSRTTSGRSRSTAPWAAATASTSTSTRRS